MIRTVRGLRDGVGVLLAGVALLTAGWLFVRFGSGNMARLASLNMREHVDFDTFWRSSAALLRGTDLYRTGAELLNLNPPLVAVLLAPLALFDALSAYHAFALLTVLMVLGSVIAVTEELRLRPAWTVLVTAALLASSPLHGTLALGQVYGLLTVALTVAWLAERRDRPVLAGVAIGLAVAIKLSLVPLLLWLALGRRWSTLGPALLAGAAGTAVGVLASGWPATMDWLRVLASVEVTGYLDNDSLAALAVRFDRPRLLGYLVASAALAITLWRVRRRPDYAIWAVTASSLLLAPIAWNNYLVLLAPAVPILLAHGRWPWALPLMTLPMIGIDWSALWSTDSVMTRVAYSLYCAMLLTYWGVLTFGPMAITDRLGRPSTNSTPGRFDHLPTGMVSSSSSGG